MSKLIRVSNEAGVALERERECQQRAADRVTPPGILRIRITLGEAVENLVNWRATERARKRVKR